MNAARILARLALPALCALAPIASPANAEPFHFVLEQTARPVVRGEIPLGTPTQPDMPPETWGYANGNLDVRNVSTATLTPFLPPAGTATGAAVVVAPGGAFLGLAIDTEGYQIARWLANHGIAAFVLKYRILATPADFATYRREMVAMRTGDTTIKASFAPPASTPARSLEDGLAAIRMVRARATEWGVDPQRVGMMGFSAGAMTTLSVGLADAPQPRPAFIVPVYGPLAAVPVPADAPPMYNVIAANDGLFWKGDTGLIAAWWKAGRPVEFHLHQNGDHGFGIGQPGTTTLDWLDGLRAWLAVNGLLNARR